MRAANLVDEPRRRCQAHSTADVGRAALQAGGQVGVERTLVAHVLHHVTAQAQG